MQTKPFSCLKCLQSELKTLRALDDKNQAIFAAGAMGSHLTKGQLFLLTEAVFFAAFRAYEQFLRNIFLLYCCDLQPNRKKLVRSYLHPRTVQHAEMLIKSSMPFIDWSSPHALMERSEAYLKDGHPFKVPLSTNMVGLRTMKRIRNHIAHMSTESTLDFKKVLKAHYATIPLKIPRPGEYLLLASKQNKNTYYLRIYMDLIENVAGQMA
jgi:hypothetical protein